MSNADYTISPTAVAAVELHDDFWAPRLETNRRASLSAVFRKCEESGRIENFRRAAAKLAGRKTGPYIGSMPFEDTDVYKAIEGAAGVLAERPDPELDAFVDELVALIASAQESDGYLYTNRTIDPTKPHRFSGAERWSYLVMSHELYNCGHLYEAACAHYQATGKRGLLDVALKSAELILSVFNESGRHDPPGHQIIERGLARLYRASGDRRFLEEARFFLECRGRPAGRPPYAWEGNPGYAQDHKPVLEQDEAVGHVVRAVYMYSGMADVAALLPDRAYLDAVERIWADVYGRKAYLTGGLGARHTGEAFGEAWELPNATAYNETCAAIGAVLWNQRLFLDSGDAKYYDALEQTLYNSLISGVSLSGDRFFYVNPLESDGTTAFNHDSAGRQAWFEVSCCPGSLARFLPALPGYFYAVRADDIYVNLYAKSRARVVCVGGGLTIEQIGDYPWGGTVGLNLTADEPVFARLKLRIPAWARGSLLGTDLYRFADADSAEPELSVNGQALPLVLEKGYAVVAGIWRTGDSISLTLPLRSRAVLCDSRVEANRGKAALQRGPLVYCVEGRDSQKPLNEISWGDPAGFHPVRNPAVLSGAVRLEKPDFTAIPYYAWANRGQDAMRVWLNATGR